MNKLVTLYSNSHKRLYQDYFLRSYHAFQSKSFSLSSSKVRQVCPTGEYESEGWFEAMLYKINYIIKTIDITDPGLYVFADCDIQFFREIDIDLKAHDILFQSDAGTYFQSDAGTYCAGFFACRQSETVLRFFKFVKQAMELNADKKINEQMMINYILWRKAFPVKAGLLPKDKYWTIGNANGGRIWNGEKVRCPPASIVMHHANFTFGIANKLKLCAIVKKQIEEKASSRTSARPPQRKGNSTRKS
jgi:hypothetical protein